MNKIKFQTKVKAKGSLSQGLVNNNYLILFEETDDEMAKAFGFTAEKTDLIEDIKKGDKVLIGDQVFNILDISENTNKDLKKQTHVSFHIDREFDGPRQILIDGSNFPEIKEGTEIKITD